MNLATVYTSMIKRAALSDRSMTDVNNDIEATRERPGFWRTLGRGIGGWFGIGNGKKWYNPLGYGFTGALAGADQLQKEVDQRKADAYSRLSKDADPGTVATMRAFEAQQTDPRWNDFGRIGSTGGGGFDVMADQVRQQAQRKANRNVAAGNFVNTFNTMANNRQAGGPVYLR